MKRCAGFTLIELVVVVMIIGVLVAIATPKMLDIMGSATDNGARQSLSVLRDAIETYASQNSGNYPPANAGDQSTFKDALKPYLRGTFPECPVTSTAAGDVAVATPVAVDDTSGWMYDPANGDFIINVTGYETY